MTRSPFPSPAKPPVRLPWAAVAAVVLIGGCVPIGEEWGDHDAALMADGRAIAQQRCAACHTISGAHESPNPRAPAFSVIAGRYSRRGLDREFQAIGSVGHYAMPATPLGEADREALAAFIYRGRPGPTIGR